MILETLPSEVLSTIMTCVKTKFTIEKYCKDEFDKG